jgi:folate-dependent phosphoribosylglycinamide formyltransferase PurN
MSLKIVFVAFSENSLGRRILSGLIKQDNVPIHVFMASSYAFSKFRKNGIKRYIKLHGYFNLIWRIYYRLTLRKDLKTKSLELNNELQVSISEMCRNENIPLGSFDNINHPEFVDVLKKIQPDLIVLGGAPLIKEKVINIPSIGVLNSHPGILPQAKGMDVVAHSIINNIPIGVTVFKVDQGIDSGSILLKKFLNISITNCELHEVEAMVEELANNAMLETVKNIELGNYSFTPQEPGGETFRALNYKSYKLVKRKLEYGNHS